MPGMLGTRTKYDPRIDDIYAGFPPLLRRSFTSHLPYPQHVNSSVISRDKPTCTSTIPTILTQNWLLLYTIHVCLKRQKTAASNTHTHLLHLTSLTHLTAVHAINGAGGYLDTITPPICLTHNDLNNGTERTHNNRAGVFVRYKMHYNTGVFSFFNLLRGFL